MESDNVGVTVIGTHFLDLSQISNDGDKGDDLEWYYTIYAPEGPQLCSRGLLSICVSLHSASCDDTVLHTQSIASL